MNFSSSLSVAFFATISWALSVLGAVDLRHSLFTEERVSLGSSVSLRSFARLGFSASVFDGAHVGGKLSTMSHASLGSSLSLSSFLRIGSGLSSNCAAFFRGRISTAENVVLMGRFSVAAQSSLGTCGSILGDLHVYGPAYASVIVKFGGTAFVRACVQLGSLFSVDGEGQIGGSLELSHLGAV